MLFLLFTELATVPYILEPPTSLSDRTGAMPRDALESKVQVSTPALTDSASQFLGADMIDYGFMWKHSSNARESYASALPALPPNPN